MTPGQPTQGPQKWTVKPLYQSRERKALTGHFSVELPSGQPIATVYDSEERARLIAEAPNMRETLESTDIALTNMLQVCSERQLGDFARKSIMVHRDRIRNCLARLDGTVTP